MLARTCAAGAAPVSGRPDAGKSAANTGAILGKPPEPRAALSPDYLGLQKLDLTPKGAIEPYRTP